MRLIGMQSIKNGHGSGKGTELDRWYGSVDFDRYLVYTHEEDEHDLHRGKPGETIEK